MNVVRGVPVVRAVSIGFFAMVTFAALDNVALVPLGRIDLHASETTVGLLAAVYGLGMVVAPMMLIRSKRTVPAEVVLWMALLALGGGTVLTGVSPLVAGALIGQTIAGAGIAWHHIAVDTLVQQHVPANRLGTVFGTVYMFPYAAEALSYAVGVMLLTAVGARWVFIVSGLGVFATLVVIYPMLSAAVRRSPTAAPTRRSNAVQS